MDKLVFIGVNRAPPEARRVAIRERVAKVRAEGIDVIVEAIVKGGLSPHTLSEKPEVVAFVRELLTRQSDEGYAKSCEAMAAAVAADAAAIKAPVLLVAGRDDSISPPANSEALAADLANARVQVLKQRGQPPPIEQPAALNAALREFLWKSTSPRRAALATKIRHIALSVQDPEGTAKFYEEAFGLVRVGKTTSVLADGVYLSDGYLNIALLKYKSDEMAGMKGGAEFVGTHHFGFQVDDAEESKKRIEECGGKFFMDLPALKDTLYYEEKFRDPEGVIFDISQHGGRPRPSSRRRRTDRGGGRSAPLHARGHPAVWPQPSSSMDRLVIRSLASNVDRDRTQARTRRSRLANTKSQANGSGHCSRSCTPTVGWCATPGCSTDHASSNGDTPSVEGATMRAKAGSVMRQLKSPVSTADGVCGRLWNGPSERSTGPVAPRMLARLGMAGANTFDLRLALHRGVVLEVGGHHPQQAERRLQDRLEQHPRHVGDVGVARAGQLHAGDLMHRQAAQDHVAEGPPTAVGRGGVDGDAGDRGESRQQRRDLRELVFAGTALQRREVASHLLQAEDVEIGERPGLVDDGALA